MQDKNIDTALIVLARKPILGQVKTRLANETSTDFALFCYNKLLSYTIEMCHKTICDKLFFVTPNFISSLPFPQHLQIGNDLGEIQKNASSIGFDCGYHKIMIIGADCPTINHHHIHDAISLLDDNDVVIGPAIDGGYYLIGLKKPCDFIFENMPWSESHLLNKMISKIEQNQLKYALLEVLNDIDTLDDLKPFMTNGEINF
ncbi:MAG: TIGR04282 family arsenosugar biosynthesis glycosyltransferase [Saprospiraceae bacterium]|nr:TIGR04282 family arsenosugar biosynthesis glycosyltransferase [Saprospiraceae bacterium]